MEDLGKDLDLSMLEGCRVEKVDSGEHRVQIHLQPAGFLGIDGPWTYQEASGIGHGATAARTPGDCASLERIIGLEITRSIVDPLRCVTFVFDNGSHLTLRRERSQEEPYSIRPFCVLAEPQ